MTDAREIIAAELARITKTDMAEVPPYTRASIRTAALHVERSLHAAGLRIIGKDEVDQVTVEKCAEVAENCPDTPFAESRRWHGNLRQSIPAAIRAIGRKA